jgi:hypothetical protein
MAVPFYIPDEDEANVSSTSREASSTASTTQNSPTNSPSRAIPIPMNNNLQSPQQSPIDNEILVQAFYEALCRCSQGLYKKIFFLTTRVCRITKLKTTKKSSRIVFYLKINCLSILLNFILFCTQSVPHMSRKIFETLKNKKPSLKAKTMRKSVVARCERTKMKIKL